MSVSNYTFFLSVALTGAILLFIFHIKSLINVEIIGFIASFQISFRIKKEV